MGMYDYYENLILSIPEFSMNNFLLLLLCLCVNTLLETHLPLPPK